MVFGCCTAGFLRRTEFLLWLTDLTLDHTAHLNTTFHSDAPPSMHVLDGITALKLIASTILNKR